MLISIRSILFATLCVSLFLLVACEKRAEEPSVAEKGLDGLQRKYEELVKDKVDIPVDWAAEDLENIGDWEYRVENITYSSPEELAIQLNEFGNDRWDVIWLEKTPGGYLAVMKKPSISYLSKIPLSQLSRIILDGGEGQ